MTFLFLIVGSLLSGWGRLSLFLAAAICFFFASFRVWQDQQGEVAALSEQIAGRRVQPYFDMGCGGEESWVSVSNLGVSHFLLQRVHIERDDGLEFVRETHMMIEPGGTAQAPLSNEIYSGESFDADFELRLGYRTAEGVSEKSEPKCFSVDLGCDGRPSGVAEGLNGLWITNCPSCGMAVAVDVYGLETFEAAEERERQVVSDVEASCPEHKSTWVLTTDIVRAQQEDRRKRPKSI